MAADFGITGLLTAVGANAEALAQQAVNKWLAGPTPLESANGAVHITAMLAVEALTTTMNPLIFPKATGTGQTGAAALAAGSSVVDMNDMMNSAFKLTMFPNIEGIVIISDSESGSRDVDVSEHPMVVQADSGSTTYVMDNAVPKPRTWALKGYIMSNLATDNFYILKPSIVMQKTYLDMCAQSRLPVWYKTYDNTFVRVLITHVDYTWDPKYMNGLPVNIQLKEYVPFEVYSGLAKPSDLAAVGKYLLV